MRAAVVRRAARRVLLAACCLGWVGCGVEPLPADGVDGGVEAGLEDGPEGGVDGQRVGDGGAPDGGAPDSGAPADVVRPLVLGHRGAGWNRAGNPYPENSMLAVRAALEMGADGVEIDLVKTADDVFVLRHDDHMSVRSLDDGRPRTSCGGQITRKTWAELDGCEALSHAEDGFEAPLDRVEALLAEPGVGLIVLDVKNDGFEIEGPRSVALLAELIADADAADRVVLMLYSAAAIAVGVEAGLRTCLKRHAANGATVHEMTAAVVETDAWGSCANATLVDGPFMDSLRGAGLGQITYLQIDDAGDRFDAAFGELADVGADGVITGLITEARRVRAARLQSR